MKPVEFLICFTLMVCEQCKAGQDFKFILNAIIPNNFMKGNIKLGYDFDKSQEQLEVNSSVAYNYCQEVPSSKGSGAYNLTLEGETMSVYCDINATSCDKYLVIQRRLNGKENFYRNWTEYEVGFGNISGEFWIGNRALNLITSRDSYKLRIDMEAFDSTKVYAEYDSFTVGPPESKYTLSVSGYSGTAGDSLSGHSGHNFSTHDQDNDAYSSNCAQTFHGAWWYAKCHVSNLNGNYFNGHHDSYANGVNWYGFRGYHESMKTVVMKIIRNSDPASSK